MGSKWARLRQAFSAETRTWMVRIRTGRIVEAKVSAIEM
jgi:hypothetical protein